MSSSFKRRILGRRMGWSRRLLLLGTLPQSFLPTQPLSRPIVMGRPFFLPDTYFLNYYHYSAYTILPGLFSGFSFPSPPVHSIPDSSPISLYSPPSYSDFLSSLASHTSMDRPVPSSSCTLTSPSPSSLPPSYSIYRPIPIYTFSRPSSSSMGCIPYLYSAVLSTNTLSLSYHGSSSTRVSSASSGLFPSGPKKRATSSQTRDWLRSWPRDNTYYTTRRQCPRPTTPGSSFPLLSSRANPSTYQDNPMNLTCNSRTNLQAPGGSSSNPLFRSDFSYPYIYSPMVTFNEPSENVRGMFSFVLSCEFSPGTNNKLLLSSLIKR